MNKHNSLTKSILMVLEKSVDGYVRLEDFIYNTHLYNLGYDRPLKKNSLAQALSRVRKNGWVELIEDQEIILKLTDLGKERAVLVSLESEEEKWDGRWRIIIFDIPEKRRVARDMLRLKLKLWGFELWQKSVWVTKKNCTLPLREFIKKVGIKEWVLVFESDNLDY